MEHEKDSHTQYGNNFYVIFAEMCLPELDEDEFNYLPFLQVQHQYNDFIDAFGEVKLRTLKALALSASDTIYREVPEEIRAGLHYDEVNELTGEYVKRWTVDELQVQGKPKIFEFLNPLLREAKSHMDKLGINSDVFFQETY